MRAILLLALVAALFAGAGCGPADRVGEERAPSRLEIWREIEQHAARYRIEPGFVYALVAAEPNFNPRAANGEARGLLQLKPVAWNSVRRDPYEPTVWEWRENLRAGIDYLALCRQTLHAEGKFSYPRLLAAFHYGLSALEAEDWDETEFEVPPSAVYRQLWSGNRHPLPPPT